MVQQGAGFNELTNYVPVPSPMRRRGVHACKVLQDNIHCAWDYSPKRCYDIGALDGATRHLHR